jgi:hypothetical protein
MYDISTKTLKDRRELLKIKTLSLMVEVALIRREEAKQRKFTRKHAIDPALQREMYLHRTKDLRPVQRQTHVARGFIKGKTLPQMEQYPINLLTEKDWAKITAMVAKYGNKEAIAHYERADDPVREQGVRHQAAAREQAEDREGLALPAGSEGGSVRDPP